MASRREILTEGQLIVLKGLRDGRGDKEIGVILGVSYRTATGHVRVVLKKLQVGTRAQAVAEGMRQGLIK